MGQEPKDSSNSNIPTLQGCNIEPRDSAQSVIQKTKIVTEALLAYYSADTFQRLKELISATHVAAMRKDTKPSDRANLLKLILFALDRPRELGGEGGINTVNVINNIPPAPMAPPVEKAMIVEQANE